MAKLRADMKNIAKAISGKSVSHMTHPDPQRIEMHFADDSVLVVAVVHGHLTASLTRGRGDSTADRRPSGPQPTRRQRDYLDFIAKYMFRYGVSPAESDIARHFLVSAPSVNQMVQTLERRGFIARQPRIPRSITITQREGASDE